MKKVFLYCTSFLLLGFVSNASALLVADVGDIDPLLAVADRKNAHDEVDFINEMVGLSWTLDDVSFAKDSFGMPVFEEVTDGELNQWAFALPDKQGYYLFKTGNGNNASSYDMWLFQNNPNTSWGTFAFTPDGTPAGNGYLYDGGLLFPSAETPLAPLAGTLSIYDWTKGKHISGLLPFDITNLEAISHITPITTPITPIPEPATMLLFGTGIAGLAGVVARRRKR